MRCDGKPVRPGTGIIRPMSEALKPVTQNGTLFADSIRASSPNRLHQQAGQKTAPDQCHCVNLSLATREPSTEDSSRTSRHFRKVPGGDIYLRPSDTPDIRYRERISAKSPIRTDAISSLSGECITRCDRAGNVGSDPRPGSDRKS